MVEITSTHKHIKTRQGQVDATGSHLGNTTLGHSQYSVVYGKGSNRKSLTMHCSKATIDAKVKELQSMGL